MRKSIMNFFTKVAFSFLIISTSRVCPTFSRCVTEPKSLQMLDEILLELKRPSSLVFYGCDEKLHNRMKCETKEKKFPSISNQLLQKLWILLYELETERECKFDETEWSWIKEKISVAQGERVTKESQPDVFIIPNFLKQEQCKELVKIHEEISRSINTKYELFL